MTSETRCIHDLLLAECAICTEQQPGEPSTVLDRPVLAAPLADLPREFRAKFASVCPTCGGKIARREWLTVNSNGQVVHRECLGAERFRPF